MPEAIWSRMRSGVILYDFTRIVEELVFNSLDAGATKVLSFTVFKVMTLIECEVMEWFLKALLGSMCKK